MKKTHRVITLPADFKELAPFFTDSIFPGKLASNNRYFDPPKPGDVVSYITFKDCDYKHIYILSDEAPRENDWVHERNLNQNVHVYQVYKRNGSLGIFRFRNVFVPLERAEGCRKIVATTHRELKINTISESFVNAFVSSHNNRNTITEADLEMTPNPFGCFGENEPNVMDFDSKSEFQERHSKWKSFVPSVKTREDGTVIVHQSKTFTKNDILKLFPKERMDKTIRQVTNTYGKDDMAQEKANSFGVGYQMAWDHIVKDLNNL